MIRDLTSESSVGDWRRNIDLNAQIGSAVGDVTKHCGTGSSMEEATSLDSQQLHANQATPCACSDT